MRKKPKTFDETYKEAQAMMENKTQEEVNAEIAKLKKTDITKGMMLVYFEKFAKSEADQKWIQSEFKEASYVETNRTIRSIEVDVVDANGKPVFDENGKVIKEKKKVKQVLEEKYVKFDIQKARDAFINHFNLKTDKKPEEKDAWAQLFGI